MCPPPARAARDLLCPVGLGVVSVPFVTSSVPCPQTISAGRAASSRLHCPSPFTSRHHGEFLFTLPAGGLKRCWCVRDLGVSRPGRARRSTGGGGGVLLSRERRSSVGEEGMSAGWLNRR